MSIHFFKIISETENIFYLFWKNIEKGIYFLEFECYNRITSENAVYICNNL